LQNYLNTNLDFMTKKNPGAKIQTSGSDGAGGTSVYVNNTIDKAIPVRVINDTDGKNDPVLAQIVNSTETPLNAFVTNSGSHPISIEPSPSNVAFNVNIAGYNIQGSLPVYTTEPVYVAKQCSSKTTVSIADKSSLADVVTAINAKLALLNANPGTTAYEYKINLVCCNPSADTPKYGCIMEINYYMDPS